jgi:spore germination protein YaaH
MTYRLAEVFEGEEFRQVDFEMLRKGDVYALVEFGSPCERLVSDKRGHSVFVAIAAPEPCDPPGNWRVRCCPFYLAV